MDDKITKPRCHIPWQQMVIDSDGTVVPCCYWSAYGNVNPPCGNLNKQSLLEIWNSDVYRNLRDNMAKGDLEKAGCSKCLAIQQGVGLDLRYDIDSDSEEPVSTEYTKNMRKLKQEIGEGKSVLKSLPTVISLTPSHVCNYRCIHCYQDSTREVSLQRKDAVAEILSLIPVLVRIVAGGGEPFIIPLWKEFLKSSDLTINPYLNFATSTNASIISDEILSSLNKFKTLALNVSFDGATKEVYEKVRINGNFGNVVNNIDRLIEITNKKPNSFTSITMSVMKANIINIPELIRFAASRKLDFGLSPVLTMPIDQAINCFNNPVSEMKGWKEAIELSYNLFDELFQFKLNELNEASRIQYRNYITVLDKSIPWDILKKEHFLIEGKIDDSMNNAYKNQYGDNLIIAIFPYGGDKPQKCMYYAIPKGNTYSVYLPNGKYALGLYPRNVVPGYFPNWNITIYNGKVINDLYVKDNNNLFKKCLARFFK
ncbi:MAG: SPASM domain-containing protein [Bacillota bacterium]|nr:SPASM domain-containing protein [Bacillota bacterium]